MLADGRGKVLLLRSVRADGKSHGEFQYPLSVGAVVECPDWDPDPTCGGGLHALPWGIGNNSLLCWDDDAWWQVFECDVADVVAIDQEKAKFRRGVQVFLKQGLAPGFALAQAYLIVNDTRGDSGSASASGDYGSASASGDYGSASASGDYGSASASGDYGRASASGDYGRASASGNYGRASASGDSGSASASGDSGSASASGDYGSASASGNSGSASASGDYGRASASGNYGRASASGDSGRASASGDYGRASASGNYGRASASGKKSIAASIGYGGKAMAGIDGCLVVAWFDEKSDRPRVCVGYVGEDGIKSDTWYEVRDGVIAECS